MTSAAHKLLGLTLSEGWKISKKITRPMQSSGGNFSHGYVAEKNGKKAFVKALDFKEAFGTGVDTVTRLQELTSMYAHERDLLAICGEKRLSNVVVAIGHGSIDVPGMASPMEGRAFYLIFELAESDVRIQVDTTTAKDTAWSLGVLYHTTLGLWQVHRQQIAHQDIKPSNVLIYPNEITKISDFGRASRMGKPALVDLFPIAGDRTYAPPELLYGNLAQDFSVRRFGCDLYMLGNIAGFLFTGINVTSSLLANIDPSFHFQNWMGRYEDVLPYLQNSFSSVLLQIRANIDQLVAEEICTIVTELCNPDIEKRGIKKFHGTKEQYSLERYVSRIDLLKKNFAVRARVGKVA